MRSIRGSKFIAIDSGECTSFEAASKALNEIAQKVSKQLADVMPVSLIKVEIISFERIVSFGNVNKTVRFWFATGLMIKLS